MPTTLAFKDVPKLFLQNTEFSLTVGAHDEKGQLVPTFNGVVVLSIEEAKNDKRPHKAPNASLKGTVSVKAVNGIATFLGLSVNTYVLQHTMFATSSVENRRLCTSLGVQVWSQIVDGFVKWTEDKRNKGYAKAVGAVDALMNVVKKAQENKVKSISEFNETLQQEVYQLIKFNETSISVKAACEFFNTTVVGKLLGVDQDLQEIFAELIKRGKRFTDISENARDTIGKHADRFVRDGQTIMVHGYSRVVLNALIQSAKQGKNFKVMVAEARPDCAGYRTCKELGEVKIPCMLILDSAVAHFMDQVDFVVMGAEGIAESGGTFNKVGSYQVSMVAKTLNKPVYVLAESFKFVRLFPLNQSDLLETKDQQKKLRPADSADLWEAKDAVEGGGDAQQGRSSKESDDPTVLPFDCNNPANDYTPPAFITLIFTDLGILTPSTVSDELIKVAEQGNRTTRMSAPSKALPSSTLITTSPLPERVNSLP